MSGFLANIVTDRLKIMKKITIFLLFLIFQSTLGSLSAQWWDGVSSFGTVREPKLRRYGSFGEWTYGMPLANITSEGRFGHAGMVRDENGTFIKADRNAYGSRFAEPFARQDVLTEIPLEEIAPKPVPRQTVITRTRIVPFEVVTASVPQPAPPRQERIVNYYQRMAKRQRTRQVSQPEITPEEQNQIEQDRQWLRELGREELEIRKRTETLPPSGVPYDEYPESQTYVIPPQRPIRDMAQKLEIVLIQSLDVLPLSPLFVSFENGTATVTGTVVGESDRLRAEQILLEQPGVEQVVNHLKVEHM